MTLRVVASIQWVFLIEALKCIHFSRLLVRLPVFDHLTNLLHTLLQVLHSGTVAKSHEVDAFALPNSASVPRVYVKKDARHDYNLDEKMNGS